MSDAESTSSESSGEDVTRKLRKTSRGAERAAPKAAPDPGAASTDAPRVRRKTVAERAAREAVKEAVKAARLGAAAVARRGGELATAAKRTAVERTREGNACAPRKAYRNSVHAFAGTILLVVNVLLWTRAISTWQPAVETWFEPIYAPNSFIAPAMAATFAFQILLQEDPAGATAICAAVLAALGIVTTGTSLLESFRYDGSALYNGTTTACASCSLGRNASGPVPDGSLTNGTIASLAFCALGCAALCALYFAHVVARWCAAPDGYSFEPRSHDLRPVFDSQTASGEYSAAFDSYASRWVCARDRGEDGGSLGAGERPLGRCSARNPLCACGAAAHAVEMRRFGREASDVAVVLGVASIFAWALVGTGVAQIVCALLWSVDRRLPWSVSDSANAPAQAAGLLLALPFPRDSVYKRNGVFAAWTYARGRAYDDASNAGALLVVVIILLVSGSILSIQEAVQISGAVAESGATFLSYESYRRTVSYGTFRSSATTWRAFGVTAADADVFATRNLVDHWATVLSAALAPTLLVLAAIYAALANATRGRGAATRVTDLVTFTEVAVPPPSFASYASWHPNEPPLANEA